MTRQLFLKELAEHLDRAWKQGLSIYQLNTLEDALNSTIPTPTDGMYIGESDSSSLHFRDGDRYFCVDIPGCKFNGMWHPVGFHVRDGKVDFTSIKTVRECKYMIDANFMRALEVANHTVDNWPKWKQAKAEALNTNRFCDDM